MLKDGICTLQIFVLYTYRKANQGTHCIIKKELNSYKVLVLFNPESAVDMYCAASSTGVRTVIMQLFQTKIVNRMLMLLDL